MECPVKRGVGKLSRFWEGRHEGEGAGSGGTRLEREIAGETEKRIGRGWNVEHGFEDVPECSIITGSWCGTAVESGTREREVFGFQRADGLFG